MPIQVLVKSVMRILASSRVSELRVWKRLCTWRQMPFPTCWGRRKAQQEVGEWWCERVSCYIEGVRTIWLCVSRFKSENIYSKWTCNVGIKTRRQLLQRHLAPNQNSGKKGSIERYYPKVCVRFMSVVFARRNSRTYHTRILCTKKHAPAKQHVIWRKSFTSSRIRTKLRFTVLVKQR